MGTTFRVLVPVDCLEPDFKRWIILPDFSIMMIDRLGMLEFGWTYMIDTAYLLALTPRSP